MPDVFEHMKLAGLALLLPLIAIAHRAEAECGNPHWLGTPTGATIPQQGSLYLYDQSLEYTEALKPRGGPIVKQTKVGKTVVKLDYVTKADELELKDDFESSLFQVSRTWQPPAAAPRVIQYWHHLYHWTCSSADSLMVQIDQPTAAFRAIWRFRDQPAQEYVIPARTETNNVSVLELGKINCGTYSIDPRELMIGGQLTLFAIRFDGSEVAVTGLPPQISTSEMPTSEDGVSRAIGFQAGTEPVSPVPPPNHDWPYHLFLLLLIPAAALLYIAFHDRSVKAVV